MNLYTVVFAPEAEEQLAALYRYIAAAASSVIAERYTNAIITHCEGMHAVPNRGTRRDPVILLCFRCKSFWNVCVTEKFLPPTP